MLDIEIPKFVKEAQLNPDDVPQHQKIAGEFPVHTKAATWCSIAAFLTHEGSYNTKEKDFIEPQLKEAAKLWDIDIEGLRSEFKKANKIEYSDTDFALTTIYNGEKINLYPITSPQQVQKSAKALYDDRSKLPYSWRKHAALNIAKKAYNNDLAIPKIDYICSILGGTECDLKKMAARIQYRGNNINKHLSGALSKEAGQFYNELAKMAAEHPDKTTTILDEIVEGMAQVEEHLGINTKYADIDTPEEIVYNTSGLEAVSKEAATLKVGEETIDRDSVTLDTFRKAAKVIGGEFKKAVDDTLILSDPQSLLDKIESEDTRLFFKAIN